MYDLRSLGIMQDLALVAAIISTRLITVVPVGSPVSLRTLLYPVTAYGIDTSVIEINRSLALTRNNLNIITNTQCIYDKI